MRLLIKVACVVMGLVIGGAGLAVDPGAIEEVRIPLGAARVILLDEELIRYFHVDVPQRQPVRVFAGLMPDVSSLDLPYQVEMVPRSSAKTDDVLQVTSVHKGPDRLVVQFRYPIEGIAGRFVLAPSGDRWTLEDREIHERK